MRRFALLTTAMLGLVGLAAPGIEAAGNLDQDNPPPPSTVPETPVIYQADADTIGVEAGTTATVTIVDQPPAGSSGATILCGYYDLHIDSVAIIDITPARPEPDQAYLWFCWQPPNHPVTNPLAGYPIVVVYDPPYNPPGTITTQADVIEHAIANIDFQPPQPLTSPADTHIVGIPTWLAVTSQLDYDPVTARAGPLWATARPEFAHVTWNLGNGDTITCTTDATTTWNPDHPDRTSDCTYTYESSSDEPFTGSVTTTWTIHQQTNTNPTSWTTWGNLTLTTPITFTVTELQATIN